MPAHLECLSPPHRGKHLVITSDKPVVIKTNKADQKAGEVRVELLDGAVVLTNHSRMTCAINATQRERGVLHNEDRLTIGKQAFRVVIDDEDGGQTQLLSAVESEAAVAPANPVLCSACDAPFDNLDHTQGWTSSDHRICRRCLSKGVRPGNLPEASPAPPRDPVEGSTSDSQRRQRRLSASRLAQVEAPGKPSLLSKVGQVFSGREERRKLEALEQERRGLLEAAGRLALSEGNGFGLPDHLIAPLSRGATVSLRPTDFSLPSLERWRSLRERLAFLDAEIAALRSALQLGPDPGARPLEEPLRSVQMARQNRTFAMLDAIPTMDLEADQAGAEDPVQVRPEPRAASTSERRKSPRRHP